MNTDQQALRRLGFDAVEQIGTGAEAIVYAVSDDMVVRLLKPGGTLDALTSRVELLAEIRTGSGDLPFKTPCVESILSTDGRHGTLEWRLPGEQLTGALENCTGTARETLLRAWLDVSTLLSDIRMNREWFGELAESDLRGYSSFHSYWNARLDRSIRSRDPLYSDIDVRSVATAFSEPDEPKLVHLDLYSDNLLWDGERISAVLDFGFCSIMGDKRLSPLFSALYILAFPVGNVTGDRRVVNAWLEENYMLELLPSAELMMACYWSFVDDDPEIDVWCRSKISQFRADR